MTAPALSIPVHDGLQRVPVATASAVGSRAMGSLVHQVEEAGSAAGLLPGGDSPLLPDPVADRLYPTFEVDALCSCGDPMRVHFPINGRPWNPAPCGECECSEFEDWSNVYSEKEFLAELGL